jgi:phospholipase C
MNKKALENARLVLSRRRMLQGTAALVSAAAAGCADEAPGSGGTDGEGTSTAAPDPTNGSTGVGTASTSDASTSVADGSSGAPGDSSSGSSGASEGSSGTDTGEVELTPEELLAPIEHIIIVCMENRSFDHYLGALQLAEGNAVVDGLSGTETNPDQNGQDVAVFEMDNFTPEDPPHGWGSCHNQWNMGENDGFVLEHFASHGDAIKHEVMGYHVRGHLPIYYALADAYTVCDRWFCGLLGPTWPNRYYLHCASSSGTTTNVPASPPPPSIMDACNDAGITNRNYFDGLVAWRWGAFPIAGFSGTTGIGEFFDKLQNGGLEQVVIIDPDFMANDDHPSHDIQLGQALVASIYEALAQSDYWQNSLLIITYDEHGGFFDHVPPPTTEDANGPEFAQMGFRVPAIVVGPHVRKGAIVSTELEHSSFAKTVALRFGLEPLNERAEAASDLSSCIDPAYLDDPQDPIALPPLDLDDDRIMANAGQTTSQPELFAAAGIELPLQGDQLARHRASLRAFVDRARRLGVARPKTR